MPKNEEVMADEKGNKAQAMLNDLGQAALSLGAFVAILTNTTWRRAVGSFAGDVGAGVQKTAAWFERLWLYNFGILFRGLARNSAKVLIVSQLAVTSLLVGAWAAGSASWVVLAIALVSALLALLLYLRFRSVFGPLAELRWVSLTERLGAQEEAWMEHLSPQKRNEIMTIRRAEFRARFRHDHGTLPKDHSPAADATQIIATASWYSILLVATAMVAYVFRTSDGRIYPFTAMVAVVGVVCGLYAAGIAILAQEAITGFLLQAVNAGVRVSFETGKAGVVMFAPNITDENADAKLGTYHDEVKAFAATVVSLRKEALLGPALIGAALIAWQHTLFMVAMVILMVPSFLQNSAKHVKGVETLESERRNLGVLSIILTLILLARAVMLVDYASGCYVTGFLNTVIDMVNAVLTFRLAFPRHLDEVLPFLGFISLSSSVVWLAWKYSGKLIDVKAHWLSKSWAGLLIALAVIVTMSQVFTIVGQSKRIPNILQACEVPASSMAVANTEPPPPTVIERHIVLPSEPMPQPVAVAIITPVVHRHTDARSASRESSDPCFDRSDPDYQAMLHRDGCCDPRTGRYNGCPSH